VAHLDAESRAAAQSAHAAPVHCASATAAERALELAQGLTATVSQSTDRDESSLACSVHTLAAAVSQLCFCAREQRRELGALSVDLDTERTLRSHDLITLDGITAALVEHGFDPDGDDDEATFIRASLRALSHTAEPVVTYRHDEADPSERAASAQPLECATGGEQT
jgi:hypothetical protein